MRRLAGSAALLLLAAAAAGADEPAAPLAQTRQELRQLQRDQAVKKSGAAADKLSDGLPQFQTPIPGALPLPAPETESTRDTLKKKKRDAGKNWLVDGVNRLEKSEKGRGKGGAGAEDLPLAATDAKDERPDPGDPEYILKVYDQQKRAEEAKAEPKPPTADPLAPFLQDWLGTSPVRGKFFDEFSRRPETAGASDALAPVVSPVSGTTATGPADFSGPARSVRSDPAPNPYLQGLDLPALHDSSPSAPATAPAAAPVWAPGPLSPSPSDPVPAARSPERKALPAPGAENQKYFPQQKKF
jgi:hypothetical protein